MVVRFFALPVGLRRLEQMWYVCGLSLWVKNDRPYGANIMKIIDSQGLPLRAAPWAKNDRPCRG